MSSEQQNNKRIAKNTGLLYFRMIFQMIISLYTSRVVLQALGFVDYGIYNVVGGVVAMFDFLNNSMSNATTRFLTYELGKGTNLNRMHKVFSTALIIHLLICLIVLVLTETVGLWYVNNHLVVPPDRLLATNVVFQCSIIAALFAIWSVPYNAAIISHEKMSAFAYITILESVSTLIVVFYVKVSSIDHLIIYAILLMILKLIIRLIYGLYCKKNFDEIKGSICFDKKIFKEMAVFAGWIMNGCLGYVFYTQGLNILLNAFFNPVVNAARGIAVQVQGKVMGFCTNFQMAVNPQITKSYASNNIDYMHKLIVNTSKYSFLLIFCLSFPIILEIDKILELWLDKVPDYTSEFVIFILLIGMIESLKGPINTAIQATGKIKVFQIVEGTLSMLIFPFAYLALLFYENPLTVFIVQLLMFVVLQIIRVWIVCPKINMGIWYYIKNIILKIIKVLTPIVISTYVFRMFCSDFNPVVEFFCTVSFAVFISVICIFYLGIEKEMRLKILSKIWNNKTWK